MSAITHFRVCACVCARVCCSNITFVFFLKIQGRGNKERDFLMSEAVNPSAWVSETGQNFRNLCLVAAVVGFHRSSLANPRRQPQIKNKKTKAL